MGFFCFIWYLYNVNIRNIMKYIITEKQSLYYNTLRRRYSYINDFIISNLTRYYVCDYKYEYGLYEYFNDVKFYTTADVMYYLFSMTEDEAFELGRQEEYNEIWDETADFIFDQFFPLVEEYFNKKIKSC